MFDELREDPRFLAHLERTGLSGSAATTRVDVSAGAAFTVPPR
jgi:hypothetical protein